MNLTADARARVLRSFLLPYGTVGSPRIHEVEVPLAEEERRVVLQGLLEPAGGVRPAAHGATATPDAQPRVAFVEAQKGMFKVLEGLMEMAGMDDMARQLRPSEPAKRGASADPATSDVPEAVDSTEDRSIPAPVTDESRDRAKIAAAGGSESASNPSIAPLRLVESTSQAMGTPPDDLESASKAVAAGSDPPSAAKRPMRPSSGRLGASTHPVRTASDPRGGASHPVSEDSEEVAARRHAV